MGCVFNKPSLGSDCELKAMVGGYAICESRVFHTRKGITFFCLLDEKFIRIR